MVAASTLALLVAIYELLDQLLCYILFEFLAEYFDCSCQWLATRAVVIALEVLRVSLRNEDLGVALHGDALERFGALADHEADHTIRDLELHDLVLRRFRIEWIRFANMYLNIRIQDLRLVVDDLVIPYNFINHFLRFAVLVVRPFHEDVSHAGGGHILFRNLDFRSAFQLELSDGLATLADDEADNVLGNGNDVGEGRWWSVRCHHRIIHALFEADLLANIIDSLWLVLALALSFGIL